MTNDNSSAEGSPSLVYRVKLPLSSSVVTHVAGLIRARRTAIDSRWRKLSPGRQALLVLAFLRHDRRSDLAGGNDISGATLRRWVLEVIGLLTVQASRLDRALKKIAAKGGVVVLLDGTLVRTRRRTGQEARPNYSGKRKDSRPALPRPDR
ncbi:hypothetical protein ABTX62_33225 [Streptomyces sp. NPDC096046]|uniref:hypothetical protein n=1 Tax=Streptomyces sp. NPDC096046 TaxID=3155542 RepID=UPI0033277E77